MLVNPVNIIRSRKNSLVGQFRSAAKARRPDRGLLLLDEIEDPEVIEGIDNLVVDYARDLREIRLVNPDRMTIDHVELFSLNGQRIESFDEMGDLQTIDLPINSPLSTAVYIVRVFSDGKQYSRKIIIKE